MVQIPSRVTSVTPKTHGCFTNNPTPDSSHLMYLNKELIDTFPVHFNGFCNVFMLIKNTLQSQNVKIFQ